MSTLLFSQRTINACIKLSTDYVHYSTEKTSIVKAGWFTLRIRAAYPYNSMSRFSIR